MIAAALPMLGGGSPVRAYLTAGLVVALVLTGGFAWWQLERVSQRDKTIGTISAQLDEAVATANRNAAAAAEAERLARHADRIELALAAKSEARDTKVRTVIKEVYRDRTVQNPPGCPDLSPVLANGLDRLRRLRAGEAAPGSPGAESAGARDHASLHSGSRYPGRTDRPGRDGLPDRALGGRRGLPGQAGGNR